MSMNDKLCWTRARGLDRQKIDPRAPERAVAVADLNFVDQRRPYRRVLDVGRRLSKISVIILHPVSSFFF